MAGASASARGRSMLGVVMVIARGRGRGRAKAGSELSDNLFLHVTLLDRLRQVENQGISKQVVSAGPSSLS